MRLADTLFLAADTLRSRAYAQALVASGVVPDRCILVRDPKRPQGGTVVCSAANRAFGGVYVPDLSIPLENTLETAYMRTETFECGSVNDTAVVESVRASDASLVIYSGFGGEIVRAPLLRCGAPLLHMHAGWLPGYRGSTTIYYSYLEERNCGVAAILLAENIDAGPILARRRYPPPPPGADVDHEYDSAIRADLLCRVVGRYGREGRLPAPVEQDTGQGRVYYVIHPVLKHIALNAIHRERPSG